MKLFFITVILFVNFNAYTQWQKLQTPNDRVFGFLKTSNNKIFAGTENTGLWVSNDDGLSFTEYSTGLPELQYDVKDFEYSGDTIWVGITGGGVVRSTDNGISWLAFNNGFQTQSMVVALAKHGNKLFAAVDVASGLQPAGVYVSDASSPDWVRCSNFPFNISLNTLITTQSGVIMAGAGYAPANAGIQVSTDGGVTWLSRYIPGEYVIMTLKADGNTVYAGTLNGIYSTSDFGISWTYLTPSLSNIVIDDIIVNEFGVFAAADPLGVILLNNSGNIEVLSGNLPFQNDYVSALFISGNRLIASLSGSVGVWAREIIFSDVEEISNLSNGFTLFQNYPNPFNPSTTIRFALKNPEQVRLSVHNSSGEEVVVLANERFSSGIHEIIFEPKEQSSGIYFIRINVNGYIKTKKALYIK